jgi:hypothetical protein
VVATIELSMNAIVLESDACEGLHFKITTGSKGSTAAVMREPRA